MEQEKELSRQEAIRAKGFDLADNGLTYGKIKIGTKSLEDAVLNLGSIQRATKNLINKNVIYRALADNDVKKLREISNYFYKISGIYQRLCRYMAYMYKYDWFVTPYYPSDSVKPDKLLTAFK